MNRISSEQLQQAQKLEKLKKRVMRKILTKEAIERLGRVKLVKPELASQLELYLVQLHQSGQINDVIDDSKLKKILKSLTKKQKYRIVG